MTFNSRYLGLSFEAEKEEQQTLSVFDILSIPVTWDYPLKLLNSIDPPPVTVPVRFSIAISAAC